jgi:hypothetical protein
MIKIKTKIWKSQTQILMTTMTQERKSGWQGVRKNEVTRFMDFSPTMTSEQEKRWAPETI